MRMRNRKRMIDRQSLFNIHLANFIAELNQTLEEAYQSLDEALDSVEDSTDEEGQPKTWVEKMADVPPGNP
jgi:hypothetical protein